MKRLTYCIIIVICCIAIKGNTQLTNYKVGLIVQCENRIIQSEVEIYIKNKLRKTKDIDLVMGKKQYPQWQFLIDIHILEGEYESGRKTGILAISCIIFEKLVNSEIIPERQKFREEFPAVNIPETSLALYNRENITDYCDSILNDLDNDLQTYRDFSKRIQNIINK